MSSGCDQRCAFLFMFLLVGGLVGGGTPQCHLFSVMWPQYRHHESVRGWHIEKTRKHRHLDGRGVSVAVAGVVEEGDPNQWQTTCWAVVMMDWAQQSRCSLCRQKSLLDTDLSVRGLSDQWDTGLSPNFKKMLFEADIWMLWGTVLGCVNAPSFCLTFILPWCLSGGGTCHGGLLKVNVTRHTASRWVSVFSALLIKDLNSVNKKISLSLLIWFFLLWVFKLYTVTRK